MSKYYRFEVETAPRAQHDDQAVFQPVDEFACVPAAGLAAACATMDATTDNARALRYRYTDDAGKPDKPAAKRKT